MLFILLLTFPLASLGSSGVARACERKTLDLRCGSEHQINVVSANYGRLSRTHCKHSQMSDTNCRSSNSLSLVKAQCQGHSSCSVSAFNSVFGDPCRGTHKYLEVNFFCKPGGCNLEIGIDYSGHDISGHSGITVNDLEHCMENCARLQQCAVWTYHPKTYKCWLKISSSGRKAGDYAISGTKLCGGWTSLSTGDYLFSTVSGSWEDGRALCVREGGRLVEIRSKDENDAIGEFIATVPALKNSVFWIGLADQHQENDWRWQGSKLKATESFTDWNVGEPNNWDKKEHCAERYSNGKWNDHRCTHSNPPLCEKGCSKTVSLSGNGLNGMPSGNYKIQAEEHNNKPVYSYDGDVPTGRLWNGELVDWCIFQGKLGAHGGHWKVDPCTFLWGTNKGDWSQGIASSKVAADCPEDIGNQWRYYSWDGATDSGPVDPDLRLTPGYSLSQSGYTGGVCEEGVRNFEWCPPGPKSGGLVKRGVSCASKPCWKLAHCPRYQNSPVPKKVIRAYPCCCAHPKINKAEKFKSICKLGNH